MNAVSATIAAAARPKTAGRTGNVEEKKKKIRNMKNYLNFSIFCDFPIFTLKKIMSLIYEPFE